MTTLTTGKATEFIQFTRASNATVTDSDGKIKWAPHNLLTNSESFDAASWTKNGTAPVVTANAAVAPNGSTTADQIALGATASVGNYSCVTGSAATIAVDYTASVWLRTVSGTATVYIQAFGSAYSTAVACSVTTTWQLFSVTFTGAAGTSYFNIGPDARTGSGQPTSQSAVTVYAWGAALYRSDLAMQPNTSAYPMYNPTTPKNLLGYTEDFSNAAWVKVNTGSSNPIVTANVAIGPNGLQTADQIVFPATTSAQTSKLYQSGGTLFGPHTLSIYLRGNLGGEVVYLTGFNGASYFTTTCSLTTSWQRFSVSSATASGTVYLQLGQETAAGNGGISACTIYAWGAQLSDSASLDSYVPVYGAAVTSAAYYGPRRDFDPVTLACKGLLVEEQRVNSVYPSTFTTTTAGVWSTGYNSGAATSSGTAPDGSTSILATANGSTESRWRGAISLSNNTTYALSFYAKNGTGRYAYIRALYCVGGGTLSVDGCWFDLQTGIPLTKGTGIATTSITPVGSGWYRISIIALSANPIVNQIVDIGQCNGDGVLTSTNTQTMYFWGAQLEANASFATSYIPTGAATATRNADVASVSTQAFPYSATAGSFVLSFLAGTANGLIGDGSAASTILYSFGQQARSYNGTTMLSAGNNWTSNAVSKAAVAFDASGRSLVVNAGTAATDALAFQSVTRMDLGYTGLSGGYLNGHIRQITYLPRRISNTELQTRTA